MDFKDLSFFQKIDHIWEYYKVPILGTIIFGLIIITWVYNAKFRPHKELMAGVGILNYTLPDFTEEDLTEKINNELGLAETNREVKLEYFFADDQEAGMDIVAKLGAMLLSGDVTILVMDEDTMKAYAYEDYLMDLSLVYTPEELDSLEEKGLLLKYNSETVPENKNYAISLTNSTHMSMLPGFDPKQNYIAIFGANQTPEDQKKVVNLLIN